MNPEAPGLLPVPNFGETPHSPLNVFVGKSVEVTPVGSIFACEWLAR